MLIYRNVKQTQTQGKTMVTTKVILFKNNLTENDFLERKYDSGLVKFVATSRRRMLSLNVRSHCRKKVIRVYQVQMARFEWKYKIVLTRTIYHIFFHELSPHLSMKRCQKTTTKYNPFVCWMVAMSIGTSLLVLSLLVSMVKYALLLNPPQMGGSIRLNFPTVLCGEKRQSGSILWLRTETEKVKRRIWLMCSF